VRFVEVARIVRIAGRTPEALAKEGKTQHRIRQSTVIIEPFDFTNVADYEVLFGKDSATAC
jgi:hypothetical protein